MFIQINTDEKNHSDFWAEWSLIPVIDESANVCWFSSLNDHKCKTSDKT